MTTMEIIAVSMSASVLIAVLVYLIKRLQILRAENEIRHHLLRIEEQKLRLLERSVGAGERLHHVEYLTELDATIGSWLRREVNLSELRRKYPELHAWVGFEAIRRLSPIEPNQLPTQLPNPMIESVALFAGMNALMAAFQVIQRERDYRLARRTFHENFEKNLTGPSALAAANSLESVAPPEVIRKLYENAKKCWDHWLEAEDEPQMPGEERESDAAVKSCVCRQLRRIIDLNGSLPAEWREQWDLYQCATRK